MVSPEAEQIAMTRKEPTVAHGVLSAEPVEHSATEATEVDSVRCICHH